MAPKSTDCTCPPPSGRPSQTSQTGRGPSKGKSTRAPRMSKSNRAGLILPVGRIATMLHEGSYAHRISNTASIAMAAVLEYLAFEILDLAGNINPQKTRIIPRHIFLAIRGDEELDELFTSCKASTIREGGVVPGLIKPYEKVRVMKMKGRRATPGRKTGKSDAKSGDESGMVSGQSSMENTGTGSGAPNPDC